MADKPVIVWTKYRGVYAGLLPENADITQRSLPLKNAKMAIYWGTTKGIMQLAETGPTEKSRISAEADIPVLHGIIGIFDVTPEAWEKWQKA